MTSRTRHADAETRSRPGASDVTKCEAISEAYGYAKRLEGIELPIVRAATWTARPRAMRALAVMLSKLGNGWIYLLLGGLILASWRLLGHPNHPARRRECDAAAQRLPEAEARLRAAAALSGRSAPAEPAANARRAFVPERPHDDAGRRADADRHVLARRVPARRSGRGWTSHGPVSRPPTIIRPTCSQGPRSASASAIRRPSLLVSLWG